MNQVVESKAPVKVEIGPPRLMRGWAVVGVNGYGLLLMIPALAAMVAVSLMPLSVLTFLLPVLTMVVATFLLPLGFGNARLGRLAAPLRPSDSLEGRCFLVQLTLTPRLRWGLRALFEDADDIGWLGVEESSLVFHGDSVKLTVPFENIRWVRRQNIGWRGLFIYGARIVAAVEGVGNFRALEFAERSSWLLPGSRRQARKLYEVLRSSVSGRTAT